MAIVHLVEGPVGAGKSSYAATLAQRDGGVHIALDEWFVQLFSPDRPAGDFIPWYTERKARLLTLIWQHSRQLLAGGTTVILELGLIRHQQRSAFCRTVQAAGFEPLIHVLDAPREVRRERVRRRNLERGATFFMHVPEQIFELASDMWQAPDSIECKQYSIVHVDTGQPPAGFERQ